MRPCDIIREIRIKLGYTRRQFANKLGLKSKQIISYYENGQRSPSSNVAYKLTRLAAKARVRADYFDIKPEEYL